MNSETGTNIDRDDMPEKSYLWDRSDPPDANVERLERVLGAFRHEQQPLPSSVHSHRMRNTVLAAAAAIALFAGVGWFVLLAGGASLEVQALAGVPKVGTAPVSGIARLKVGQWLETDSSSRARIAVADIGQVTVEPGSRIRLVQTRQAEHRLDLDRGRIAAAISAPPRLFFVDTPSAVAIDYGCAYTLEVDDEGSGLLHVTLGMVMLEGNGHDATVPMNSMCRMRRGVGPGVPFSCDSSDDLKQALQRFNFDSGGDSALDQVLNQATKSDIVTLWHLLLRADESQRGRVFDRLAGFLSPPVSVTRDGVIAKDKVMLERLQNQVEAVW